MPKEMYRDGGRMKKVITGNHAASYGAKVCRAEVVAAYPITPQTEIVERIASFVADGEMDAEYIKVESEHSAMAACIGASASGCRAYTATSAQGLALMHEMLHWAANARLPIVMANVNRAMGPPWTVWTDQNDSLSQRDTGWLQFYCENNQEVFDTTIQAYKICEKISLPGMIVLDAFIISHTSEPVEIYEQDKIDSFLPKYNPRYKLDPSETHAFGGLTTPEWYYELRYKIQSAMDEGLKEIESVGEDFGKTFGRKYGLIEEYRCDDIDMLLVMSGSMASTGKEVIDKLRDNGKRIGLARMRVFRPFPKKEIRKLAKKVSKIIVVDRNISFGNEGIFFSEIKSALYNENIDIPVYGFIAGLGGRDVTMKDIEDMIKKSDGKPKDILWWGLK